ncbi:histidine kinase [Nocardioides sp. LHG3406-4]|uniref:sensor histidine kinase n=1 Tax=Nocardioides sp. LHG3406-4 TaxID=2804575 RepID=UPI003CF6798C
MTDRSAWNLDELLPVDSVAPVPLDERGLRSRLALTGLALVHIALAVPALVLAILTILSVALGPLGFGIALSHLVVPATAAINRVHRRLSARVLGIEPIEASYAPGSGPLGGPFTWVRDKARWRDFGHLAFAATGGFVMSVVVAGPPTQPVVNLLGVILDGGPAWWALFLLSSPVAFAIWWSVTPALVRAYALATRGILAPRADELERRVEEVTASRTATLDHSAAEIRRIERDLHDGAQARLTAIGMTVGYAESLLVKDPAAASELLAEARETTLAALEDLRALVRGIHPPVLADLGLSAAVENLAMQLPITMSLELHLAGHPPAPVESGIYFAVAECLANTIKHADARRGWVRFDHDGRRLRVVCGDDGRGGADTALGTGLAGVARRLAAFDGTMTVDSPDGGPSVITMEVPCELSSRRTRPSSGTA